MVLHFTRPKEVLIRTSIGKRVVVFPLSGYINRLQAVASASLLAQELHWDFIVVWEPQSVAAAPAEAVFSEEFCRTYVQSAVQVHDSLGIELSDIPRYLHLDSTAGVLSLAGHDRGEQSFMQDVRSTLENHPEIHTLVLVAGGHFGFTSELSPTKQEEALIPQRSAWYRKITFQDEIEMAAGLAIREHSPFLALHLRYTDRSHQVPSKKQITFALEQLRSSTTTRSLFIASDTPAARDEWVERAKAMGFEPWVIDHEIWDRSDARSAHPALIDWRVLANAEALVYFKVSSFAYEAAVASGNFDASLGLSPHKLSKARASAHELLHSAMTYPKRHGWIGSN